jgi:UDP-N-acetylglucosamine 2-epimerase (non-hydrolysing)
LKQRGRFVAPPVWQTAGLQRGCYFVLTLHRPANVDSDETLRRLMQVILDGVRGRPVVFPVHPRTARTLQRIGIDAPHLHLTEPLSYLEFNYLVERAQAVITDSGGVTEETTVLGVPCLTLRNSTERPETVTMGTNELIGTDPANVPPALDRLFAGQWKKGQVPPLWDGKTGERIVAILERQGT